MSDKPHVREITDAAEKARMLAVGKYRDPDLWWLRDGRVWLQVMDSENTSKGEQK